MDLPLEILNAVKKDYPKISGATQIEEVVGKKRDVLTWDNMHLYYTPHKMFLLDENLEIPEGADVASFEPAASVAQAKEYATVKNRFGYRTYYWIAYHERHDLLFWGYS